MNRAREKLQRLQGTRKRHRPSEETDDGCQIPNENEELEVEDVEQQNENEEPTVEFLEGKTQQGARCLWHQGE